MKRYLATLHTKSDHHKRRFALLASGSVTLLIFGIWSLATFGMNGAVVAKTEQEVSPFQSLQMNLAASFEVLGNNFKELKDGALNIYGQ